MKTLINYLKNPTYCYIQRPKFTSFIGLLFVYIGSLIPIAILIFLLSKIFGIEHLKPNSISPLKTIMIGILLAPIYEEIFFRSLLRFTKKNLILFILTTIALIIVAVFRSKILIGIILSVILFFVFYSLFFFKRDKIELFISSKFRYLFYASALFFGLIHAANFTGNIYVIIGFSLILGGPQIVLGLILGFIRMNYGLIYSILFHMMVNTALLLTLL